MEELIIDPFFWFDDRQLEHTPNHFVVTKTPLTEESLLWVVDNLKGRFSIVTESEMIEPLSLVSIMYKHNQGNISFEDPKEAILYELTWS